MNEELAALTLDREHSVSTSTLFVGALCALGLGALGSFMLLDVPAPAPAVVSARRRRASAPLVATTRDLSALAVDAPAPEVVLPNWFAAPAADVYMDAFIEAVPLQGRRDY